MSFLDFLMPEVMLDKKYNKVLLDNKEIKESLECLTYKIEKLESVSKHNDKVLNTKINELEALLKSNEINDDNIEKAVEELKNDLETLKNNLRNI